MKIEFKRLNSDTVDSYIAYLKRAMREEPDMMTAESVDEDAIKARINDAFYQRTYSILAIYNDQVVGRIEYHFYGCIQDGYRMAYVDWLYVLEKYRHRGIAQALFREFEKACRENGIDQCYLIRAENQNADKFYRSFQNVELSREPVFRKYFEQ